ncbi:MAG: transcription termination/antitermination protein NusG [Candidatus Omnitrophica bacterium]|nr:transcription termination/antitermination protein NusG [Candidatus Omnitrophota bacterium]
MKKWYVIHVHTGTEQRVKSALETTIIQKGIKDYIGQIFIPTEQVSEIRGGKRKISERKFFPGYILVEMELNEATYQAIRHTPGVTGFIGLGRNPTPLAEEEVERIFKRAEETKAKPSPKVVFEKGEQVRISDGPFLNFSGTVEEVHPEKGKLKVSVSIFGRATPIELEFWQVEKV